MSRAGSSLAAAAAASHHRRTSCMVDDWRSKTGNGRRGSPAAAASSPSLTPDTFRPPEEGPAGIGAAASTTGAGAERVGVLLLNLGGPDTLDDVQPFLYNLFADPDIIRLPGPVQWMQPLIAQLISMVRAPKSREGYAAIGGGSPLREITQSQANALAGALRQKGLDAHAYVAMRYWRPFTEEAVDSIKRDAITKLVVLPLYPQFSVSTSGSSLRLLEKLLKEDQVLRQVRPIGTLARWTISGRNDIRRGADAGHMGSACSSQCIIVPSFPPHTRCAMSSSPPGTSVQGE